MELEKRREVLNMLIAENDEIKVEKKMQELAIDSLKINNSGITYQVKSPPSLCMLHAAAVFIRTSFSRMCIIISSVRHQSSYAFARCRYSTS